MSDTSAGTSSLLRKKSIDEMIGATRGDHGEEHLTRSMSVFQLMMFGVGATIGTGIFFVLEITVPKAGPAVVITFAIVGVIAALTALCYAEVASTIPVSGSAYSYSFAALGELPAYLVGSCLILEYGVAGAATSVGWAQYFNALLDDVFGWVIPDNLSAGPFAEENAGIINLPAVILVVMCGLLLLRGARESARANAIMVLIKLGVLAFFIVIAFTAFDSGNFSPFTPEGVGGISAAIPAIFFTFLGIDAVSTAGEEVKDPGHAIPRAVFGAIIIVTCFYVLVAVAAIGAQPVADFEGQSAGLEAILNEVTGVKWPGIILAAGAVVSIFSVTLITIYGQTRILFAMGRDGMLPPMFKDVNESTLSPNKNVVFTCGFIAILAAVLPIEKLFDLVSIGTLAAFIVVSATVIILRRTRPDLERPFKVPGGPVIPVLSIIACIYAANQIPKDTWISVGIWVLGALAFYFSYSRRHSIMARHQPGDL